MHTYKKHQQKPDVPLHLTDFTQCPACRTEHWTWPRLQRHLLSTTCGPYVKALQLQPTRTLAQQKRHHNSITATNPIPLSQLPATKLTHHNAVPPPNDQ
eukprot:14951598-Alexandrium_andersonii.AAC.1